MNASKEFLAIDGIGADTAKRLVEHGIDSLDKLAAASEQDLVGIEGLPPELIPDLIDQARQRVAASNPPRDPLAELLEDATHLKDDVEKLVLHIRDRFSSSQAPSRSGKALRKEIALTLASLEKVEAALSTQLRQLNRGLAKADAKISKVTESDVKEVTHELRKARKKIDKAIE